MGEEDGRGKEKRGGEGRGRKGRGGEMTNLPSPNPGSAAEKGCKAFIGLTIRAKLIGGGPFYQKF